MVFHGFEYAGFFTLDILYVDGWSVSISLIYVYCSLLSLKVTPIAATLSQHQPHAIFCRSAVGDAPALIGCRLVKRQADGSLLWV